MVEDLSKMKKKSLSKGHIKNKYNIMLTFYTQNSLMLKSSCSKPKFISARYIEDPILI